MAGKQWGPSREEEDEYRRKLLVRARKGDVEAEHELMTKYGMRVYSDTERSKMPAYYDSGKKGSAPSLTSKPTREAPSENTLPPQKNAKAKVAKQGAKAIGKTKGKRKIG
jgi:hypothetical protein